MTEGNARLFVAKALLRGGYLFDRQAGLSQACGVLGGVNPFPLPGTVVYRSILDNSQGKKRFVEDNVAYVVSCFVMSEEVK